MKNQITDYYYFDKSESAELLNEVFPDDESAVLEWAIDEIRENRTRLYCNPALWEAEVLEDGRIRVKRTRRK